MIRFSCHSENFGKKPMEETFALIRTLEYDCVDVAARSLAPQATILAQPEATAQRVKDCAQAQELALSELFLDAVEVDGVPLDPADPRTGESAAFWKNFETICRFAQQAGFASIMGAPGRLQPQSEFEACFERAAGVLQRQSEMAAGYGLAMHVEPTRSSLLREPEQALRMVRDAAPGLRYTMDFLHFQVNGFGLDRTLCLLPFAGHLHIRQARFGSGKCRFEDGGIDYDAIVRELVRLGWSGDVCSELWCDPPQLKAGIRPVEQNLVMRYWFSVLMRRYGLQ